MTGPVMLLVFVGLVLLAMVVVEQLHKFFVGEWVDDEPIDYDLTALADAVGVLVSDDMGGAA